MKKFEVLTIQTDKLQLKDFLTHLKKQRVKPLSYSYCHSEQDLINTISLKENLSLKQSPFRNEFQIFPDHFNQDDKNHFLNFSKYIYDLNLLPEQADHQSQKVASLLKCLASEKEYLFFNQPEKHLTPLSLGAFKKIMLNLREKNHIIIASQKAEYWKGFQSTMNQQSFSLVS